MGIEFMKLLKVYIDEMRQLWEAGEYHKIHTLAVAIADMTKSSDMLDLIAGLPQYSTNIKNLLERAAAKVIIEESGGEH